MGDGVSFLKKVNPEISVIQVGKDNCCGYSHEETFILMRRLWLYWK
ncbi:MAG: hypothetical protein ACOC1S_00330 [bacterium]